MQTNIKLTLAYDGGAYMGWQKTPTGPSIEETLTAAIEKIVQHPIGLNAASRTDRGVHAAAQTANFHTGKNLDLNRFQISLNQLLPGDIKVIAVEMAPPGFHATIDAREKTYVYNITTAPYQMPLNRFTEWHYPYRLDIDLMREAASCLIGTHDFEALTNKKKNETYSHFIRTVSSISISGLYRFEIKGTHFLYKMARNLVGLIVYVGRGKIMLTDIPEILSSKNRQLSGMTAPAHGLTLLTIKYD